MVRAGMFKVNVESDRCWEQLFRGMCIVEKLMILFSWLFLHLELGLVESSAQDSLQSL